MTIMTCGLPVTGDRRGSGTEAAGWWDGAGDGECETAGFGLADGEGLSSFD